MKDQFVNEATMKDIPELLCGAETHQGSALRVLLELRVPTYLVWWLHVVEAKSRDK